MKFFRETTKGKVVAMGRKTLESFPGGQPLKNRVNVVLTSDKKYNVKGTVVVHSIDEMVEELKKYNDEDIFVIGGESIYRQLLPYCKTAYITKIDHAYQADTFFPDLDQDPQWQMTRSVMSKRILIWSMYLQFTRGYHENFKCNSAETEQHRQWDFSVGAYEAICK